MSTASIDVTVVNPEVGDKIQCPGCREQLTLDWADGWTNRNGLTCQPTNTTHSDHIRTVKDPKQRKMVVIR